MFKPEIPAGEKFGRWTVTAREGSNRKHERLYRCLCQCGVSKLVPSYALISGQSKSCGCYRSDVKRMEKTTHGKHLSSEYATWHAMIQRCTNKNNPSYKNYGGRGITVCDQWLQFDGFFKSMGERPVGMTLDRRDNNKGYSPDNCRWATRKEQQVNRRVVKTYTFGGVTGPVGYLAEVHGVSYMSMWHKLNPVNKTTNSRVSV